MKKVICPKKTTERIYFINDNRNEVKFKDSENFIKTSEYLNLFFAIRRFKNESKIALKSNDIELIEKHFTIKNNEIYNAYNSIVCELDFQLEYKKVYYVDVNKEGKKVSEGLAMFNIETYREMFDFNGFSTYEIKLRKLDIGWNKKRRSVKDSCYLSKMTGKRSSIIKFINNEYSEKINNGYEIKIEKW